MLRPHSRNDNRRRARRGFGGGAWVECLEDRRLLSFASPTNDPSLNSFGIKGVAIHSPAQTGDNFIHNFFFFLNDDAGLSSATINAARLDPGGTTVHADLSGTIVGPTGFPFDFHSKQLDFLVNGTMVANTTTFTQGADDPTGRPTANFSISLSLPAGESNDSVNFVFEDLDMQVATPQIHIFDIAVDSIVPGVSSIGPVTTPRTTPVSTVPVVLSNAIDPTTFTSDDLSLTRNGAPVSLAGAGVTVTPVAGSSTNFTIGGLSTLTATPGAYQLTLTGSGLADPAANAGTGSQSTSFVVASVPAITSDSSSTFTTGTAKSFQVTASGVPTPTIAESGALPGGVLFDSTTGILSGTADAGTGGTYNLTFTASNSAGSSAPQNFTLTVNQAPAITSNNTGTLFEGSAGTLTVVATGFPTPTLSMTAPCPTA